MSLAYSKFSSWKPYSFCDFAYYPLGVQNAKNPDTYSQIDCEMFCKSIDIKFGSQYKSLCCDYEWWSTGEKNCYVWGDIYRQIDQDRSEHEGEFFSSFIFTHREWDEDAPVEEPPEEEVPEPAPEPTPFNPFDAEPDKDEIPFKIEFMRWVFKWLENRFWWKTIQTVIFILIFDFLVKGFITTGGISGVSYFWYWIISNEYI